MFAVNTTLTYRLAMPLYQTSPSSPVSGEVEVPHTPGAGLQSAYYARAAQKGQVAYQGKTTLGS